MLANSFWPDPLHCIASMAVMSRKVSTPPTRRPSGARSNAVETVKGKRVPSLANASTGTLTKGVPVDRRATQRAIRTTDACAEHVVARTANDLLSRVSRDLLCGAG